MFCESDYYGVTEESEAREYARLDAEADALHEANEAAFLALEAELCRIADEEEERELALVCETITLAVAA